MRINRKNLIGMMLVMILLAGSSEVSLVRKLDIGTHLQ